MKIRNTILFCFITLTIQAQTVAVEVFKNNLMYAGLNNYLTIAVENMDCSQLWVKIDNGTIKKTLSDCSYECVPKYMGIARLFIYKVTKKDTILLDERKYRIKPLKGEARLGKQKDGEMTIGYFKAQQGVTAPIVNMEINASCKVERFRMQIIRQGEVIVTCSNEGARFTRETSMNFNLLQKGDLVFFDRIKTLCPGMRVPYINNTIRIQLK